MRTRRGREVGPSSKGGVPLVLTASLSAPPSRKPVVFGLALRFALSARPTGSQGCAPGKANDKDKDLNKNQNKS
jgi:hypothetical protein